MSAWEADHDAFLKANHGAMTLKQIAASLNRSACSIRGRITRLGIAKKELWTAEEEQSLIAEYTRAGDAGYINLAEVAARLGREKSNVCRKARMLGLQTNKSRQRIEHHKPPRQPMFKTKEELSRHVSVRMREHIATHGHPRGMLGKKHTQETVEALSASSSAWWAALSDEEKAAHAMKALKTKAAAGTSIAPQVQRGSWKAGWREIGGKRKYYRSRWEANYARYLQWLKERGEIAEWAHEPETFWFESIKRGVRSYLPDFRVWENDGTSALHEVKGWMDSRSKTTLSRMAKYHPQEKVILIDGRQYRAIRLKVMRLIPEWEDSPRDSHA